MAKSKLKEFLNELETQNRDVRTSEDNSYDRGFQKGYNTGIKDMYTLFEKLNAHQIKTLKKLIAALEH